MTTITLLSAKLAEPPRESGARRLAGWLATAMLRLQWLAARESEPMPALTEAAAELMRRADAYEATQPSYAADLRAAARLCR